MLTIKQRELINFIIQASRKGYAPSYQEMADALGLKSKSGIHRLVSALVDKGYVRRLDGRWRSIEVIKVSNTQSDIAASLDPVREFISREPENKNSYLSVILTVIGTAEQNGICLGEDLLQISAGAR